MFLLLLYKDPGNALLSFLMFSVYSLPAVDSRQRDIKDDNLLGIPLHFLIETRRVMDSGVERSTGPVC